MDFSDYTNILAGAGIITREQAEQIQDAMTRLENARVTRDKEMDAKFWNEELGY